MQCEKLSRVNKMLKNQKYGRNYCINDLIVLISHRFFERKLLEISNMFNLRSEGLGSLQPALIVGKGAKITRVRVFND